jgi:tetratricopeptide (TPR) repeat protein
MQIKTQLSLTASLLALVLCCTAFADPAPAPPTPAPPPVHFDFRDASTLTETKARALEDKIKSNPDDANSRAELLGYYFLHQDTFRANAELCRAHILWMIQNRPADPFTGQPFCQIEPAFDPEGYVAAKNLWKQQTEKPAPTAQILANAASFLSIQDPKAAEDLYKRAESIDPTNPDWPQDLAPLLSRRSPAATAAEKLDRDRLALAEYEKAYALSKTPQDRFYNLTPLPGAAFAAGDNAKAADYANQLLVQAKNFPHDWNYGNAIHKANLTLGQIALAKGDLETAKARLLDAGKTPGSPQLDSFGPNMELARELLQKNEKDTVLKYLSLCSRFWRMGTDKLESWRQTIKSGGTPDFGPNLIY